MGTAPLALRGLLQLRVEADQVVGPRTGVTQDDLPTLLAHLAVVLVVRLIAIAVIDCEGGRGGHAAFVPIPKAQPVSTLGLTGTQ